MIASAVSGKIAGALVEADRVKILAMIQEQVTWLAGSFLLTGHEIENLNANLARVIDQNALEIIFAAGIQQRAATNMLIKPLVVSIIRQRPVMEYDASHLGKMVNRLEEALPRSYRHNGYSAPFTFYHLICQCHRHDSEGKYHDSPVQNLHDYRLHSGVNVVCPTPGTGSTLHQYTQYRYDMAPGKYLCLPVPAG